MLYTKPIEKISYQGIVDFCSQGHRESIHLDYKKQIERNLVKTIAAMANTWGGVIVLGVDEQDSKPKLPVTGLPYQEHLREQINNLVLGNIMPPLFPEIQVCTSSDGSTALIVIRVSQSNLTPHAIRGNTQVYIRTDTSNEPEELASLDRIQWLLDRRKRSKDLKETFFQTAEQRFTNLCQRKGATVERGEFQISMTPLYPFEILCDPSSLRKDVLDKIRVSAWGGRGFPSFVHEIQFEAAQYGTYAFFWNERAALGCYEEANQYGFIHHRENLAPRERNPEGIEIHHALLHSIMVLLDTFLDSMGKFYRELAYWGMLELRIALNNLMDVGFRDLPVPRGYVRFDNIVSYPIDSRVNFEKSLQYSELVDSRAKLVEELMVEIAWALGFSHINASSVHKLLEEAGRA